jgi:hypothetical protein
MVERNFVFALWARPVLGGFEVGVTCVFYMLFRVFVDCSSRMVCGFTVFESRHASLNHRPESKRLLYRLTRSWRTIVMWIPFLSVCTPICSVHPSHVFSNSAASHFSAASGSISPPPSLPTASHITRPGKLPRKKWSAPTSSLRAHVSCAASGSPLFLPSSSSSGRLSSVPILYSGVEDPRNELGGHIHAGMSQLFLSSLIPRSCTL